MPAKLATLLAPLIEIRIEIDEKTRQNAENKQTFDLTGKITVISY